MGNEKRNFTTRGTSIREKVNLKTHNVCWYRLRFTHLFFPDHTPQFPKPWSSPFFIWTFTCFAKHNSLFMSFYVISRLLYLFCYCILCFHFFSGVFRLTKLGFFEFSFFILHYWHICCSCSREKDDEILLIISATTSTLRLFFVNISGENEKKSWMRKRCDILTSVS